MDKNKYILSDEDLFDLSELAPLTEGGLREDLLSDSCADLCVDDFQQMLADTARAIYEAVGLMDAKE